MGKNSQGHGSTHWMLERVTSMALVPLTLWLIYSVINLGGPTHVDFMVWIQNPTNAGLLIVTLLTSFYHAALGVQVILDDYVSTPSTNRCSVFAVKFAFAVMAIASVVSIIKIAF